MAWIRCPRCSHAFRAKETATQVCPACGFRGWVPEIPKAPQMSPHYRPPPEGPVGKPRHTAGYVLLTLVTGLTYMFVYYWKVFRELDRQHERRTPAAWYVTWVVFWCILLAGVAIEVLVWLADNPLRRLEVHVALFGTAFVAFLVSGAMHATLGLARFRDYRRGRGMGRPVGGFTLALVHAIGLLAGVGAAFGYLLHAGASLEDLRSQAILGLGGLGGLLLGHYVATGIVNAQLRAYWASFDPDEDGQHETAPLGAL